MTETNLPHWDLTNVYPALESPELQADLSALSSQLDELDAFFTTQVAACGPQAAPEELARLATELVERFNAAGERGYTLLAYLSAQVSTDSFNTLARRLLSQAQAPSVRLQELFTRLKCWLGRISARLPEVTRLSPLARSHAHFLQQAAEDSRYLMSPVEEALASELSLSSLVAWNKLQGTLVSQVLVDFSMDGVIEKHPLTAIINLRSHPDPDVRRRAYQAELQACAGLKEPLAAALNGVKGYQITVDKRRGRPDALHSALEDARLDRVTLEAMLAAIQASLPDFRRYFHAKARRLGMQQLAWCDLFAPTGQADRTFSFQEACDFVIANFRDFSPDLADFARKAVERHWIDAEPRPGKQGGAYETDMTAVKEPRVFINFDGSLNKVSTLAHELGHAFHSDCIFKAGKTVLQSLTPMTLAETASIMNETIVQQAALKQAASPAEELAILEAALINDSQTIVDIYSRFLFEREVFSHRQKAELSADELCQLMEWAQVQAYGDSLADGLRHPYMWTWKEHYYRSDLQFYNFPYAFGLLFGLGLYSIYQQRGPSFVADYKALLASTGEARPADLAARFGIEIGSQAFWDSSLKIISARIDRYEAL